MGEDDEALGSPERDLLQGRSLELFDRLVADGAWAEDDERTAEPAFALLHRLGLAHLDPDAGGWVAEDPAAVASRVVAPLSREADRLLAESARWSQAFAGLAQTWRRGATGSSRGPVVYLRQAAIGPYLAGLVEDVEEEILSAQPQVDRSATSLAQAAVRDTAALERGVAMRTLYQHSARRSTPTRAYVEAVTERGAEVRTLDEFFNRMIILDRRVAIIPGSADHRVAVAVREPAVVAYLVDVFERTWERGRPFVPGRGAATAQRAIVAEQRAMTIRMLVGGYADPVSAKRLGVSPRTYAGYVADLKAEFEAATRFELGYRMGREGVTGEEVEGDPAADPAD